LRQIEKTIAFPRRQYYLKFLKKEV